MLLPWSCQWSRAAGRFIASPGDSASDTKTAGPSRPHQGPLIPTRRLNTDRTLSNLGPIPPRSPSYPLKRLTPLAPSQYLLTTLGILRVEADIPQLAVRRLAAQSQQNRLQPLNLLRLGVITFFDNLITVVIPRLLLTAPGCTAQLLGLFRCSTFRDPLRLPCRP